MEPVAIAISMGIPALGGVVWLVRLEGRINVNEALQKQLQADVTYIRERIDAALNGHPK
jgi:sensor domain CHASE-containing protein